MMLVPILVLVLVEADPMNNNSDTASWASFITSSFSFVSRLCPVQRSQCLHPLVEIVVEKERTTSGRCR